MTALAIRLRWDEMKRKLKERYASLTDDDLIITFGQEAEVIERLQQKLGKKKDVLIKIISNL